MLRNLISNKSFTVRDAYLLYNRDNYSKSDRL